MTVEMTTNKERVTLYLEEGLKNELKRWAMAENRTVNNLIETWVKQELQRRKSLQEQGSGQGLAQE